MKCRILTRKYGSGREENRGSYFKTTNGKSSQRTWRVNTKLRIQLLFMNGTPAMIYGYNVLG